MEVKTYAIEGVMLLKPKLFRDSRGFFMESYNRRTFAQLGLDYEFVQDNHSLSRKHTLRGLHFQINRPQTKLVRAIQGTIFDVAVDIRPDSPTYGQWVGEILSAENHLQLLIPAGFAHGFQVLSETAEMLYKCDEFYSPPDDRGILWSDPDIGIDWPGSEPPILSDKDRALPLLKDRRSD